MNKYYVTFGVMYAQDEHPFFADAHPDGYILILAHEYMDAREIAYRELGKHWASMYFANEFKPGEFSRGELARYQQTAEYSPDRGVQYERVGAKDSVS